MSRPATFTCAWCGREKTLARTGRMPRFCSDYCRRQPVAAEQQLQNAIYHRDSAQRMIDQLEANLQRYRDAGVAETIPPAAVARNGSGLAIAAERRTA